MNKLLAILNVVAWSGFWAFGYLALTASPALPEQMVTATVLAALGAGIGMIAYLRLVRYSEQTGYATAPKRAVPEQHRDAI